MGRVARIVVPNRPHHLTQRGNRQENIFFDDADRRRYLSLLDAQYRQFGLEVWAYCLMANHVHLVVVPPSSDVLGRAMRHLNSSYASYVNRRQGLCGHLWQSRFYSTPLDQRHLWSAVRYVERNPVRAGLIATAWEYPWSSAAHHCGLQADALVRGDLEQSDEVGDWRRFLLDEDDTVVRTIRMRTRTGRPCGPAGFVADLEQLLGRTLAPKKRGRKLGEKKED